VYADALAIQNMKRRLFLPTILSIAATSQSVAFFNHDHEGHGKQKHGKHGGDEEDELPNRGQGHVRYFRPEDRIILSRYYPVETLPPGLRKKYARTGSLPPGWQKRVQPLPAVVLEQLPALPPNCERGYADGYAVVYDRTTRVILDSVDLIGALTGH
jgi:hypothetical protein